MFLHTFSHKTKSKIHKTFNKNSCLMRATNTSSIQAKDQNHLNLSCTGARGGCLQLAAPCCGGQRPAAATTICCPRRFAACQGLWSGRCGKAAADYYPLLLFHTGTNDDARGNQESIKHRRYCCGVCRDQGHGELRQFSPQSFQKGRRAWGADRSQKSTIGCAVGVGNRVLVFVWSWDVLRGQRII